ncbi:MAG: citrate/2-methylcitrate synthase [Desertimonas sp.]
MTRYVGAAEAARQLGVQRATLYAYVSRGLVERRVAVDGRTSQYSVDDIEALGRRGRSRTVAPRPSLDVHISTAITTLDEAGPRYRGREVATLAAAATYEQVAELLWTGSLPDRAEWPAPEPDDIALALGGGPLGADPLHRIIGAGLALGVHHPGDAAPATARRLFGVVPAVLAGGEPSASGDPRLAARLAAVWDPEAPPALASALKRVLVVLADHELTTSTMAVRLAASVRTTPSDALVAGLSVIAGPLHGSASAAAHRLIAECADAGVNDTVARRLATGDRLPGFGHKIYAADDPRVAPVREAIALLPTAPGRMAVVDELVAVAGQRVMHRPNVDLALGALTFTAGLPADAPLFAIARIAGLAAHYLEELAERPVRYRAIARG